MGGPCSDWVTLGEVQADPRAVTQAGDPLDPALLARMISAASEILWALSGRQFAGVCSDVVRPLRRYYNVSGDVWGWGLWRWQGTAFVCSRPPERSGGCGSLSEITLGGYPVREVIEVRVDGAVLDPSAYRVDDHRWLVRTAPDGTGWPCCQQLQNDPLTDRDTFQVTFTYGQAPPAAGVEACKAWAIELAKGASGGPCSLPERVQSVVFQGGSYTIIDPMLFLADGRTGVYLVDEFLRAFNPGGVMRRPSVVSPDIPRPVRRTATGPGS